jgi:hypothetical protein
MLHHDVGGIAVSERAVDFPGEGESPLTFSHLETVMKINEQFFFEFNGEEHIRSVFI